MRAPTVLALAALLSTAALAADTAGPTMPAPLAQEVVKKTVELVESRGLYPRQQAEYAQAKATLLAVFDGEPSEVRQKDLYGRIRKLLKTLDADGHPFLMQPNLELNIEREPEAPGDLPPPAFQLMKTASGTVLRWTPPPVVGAGEEAIPAYLKRFHAEAAAVPEAAQACALVVDLSEQSGGNAWPPLVAMFPLIGDANKAYFVDRDNHRSRVVYRAYLAKMNAKHGGGRANPLGRFAGGPLAVVASKRTASAGEMQLVALLGESRVRTFGATTYGMTTANESYPLADGALLVLSTARYAVGDAPVWRGGIEPMQGINPGETTLDAVAAAAKWVAENSPQCNAASPTVATRD